VKRPRIYMSGPLTKGDRSHNLYQSWVVQKQLMETGYAPWNPMLTMQVPFEVEYELWMQCDFPWVEVADAVLRLPGYSQGADREVAHALENNIPVFHSVEELDAARDYLWPEEVHDEI